MSGAFGPARGGGLVLMLRALFQRTRHKGSEGCRGRAEPPAEPGARGAGPSGPGAPAVGEGAPVSGRRRPGREERGEGSGREALRRRPLLPCPPPLPRGRAGDPPLRRGRPRARGLRVRVGPHPLCLSPDRAPVGCSTTSGGVCLERGSGLPGLDS